MAYYDQFGGQGNQGSNNNSRKDGSRMQRRMSYEEYQQSRRNFGSLNRNTDGSYMYDKDERKELWECSFINNDGKTERTLVGLTYLRLLTKDETPRVAKGSLAISVIQGKGLHIDAFRKLINEVSEIGQQAVRESADLAAAREQDASFWAEARETSNGGHEVAMLRWGKDTEAFGIGEETNQHFKMDSEWRVQATEVPLFLSNLCKIFSCEIPGEPEIDPDGMQFNAKTIHKAPEGIQAPRMYRKPGQQNQ